jgi:hypothetical protein
MEKREDILLAFSAPEEILVTVACEHVFLRHAHATQPFAHAIDRVAVPEWIVCPGDQWDIKPAPSLACRFEGRKVRP